MEIKDEAFYIPEKHLENQSKSVSIEDMKIIIEYCEKRICKIKCKDGGQGTGFFCSVPIDEWDTFKALITNNHVLTGNDINKGEKIIFSLNNDKINLEIIIDESRMTFTSEKYDITIIEIKKNDGLKKDSFFEIDNKIFNENSQLLFKKKSVHLLHYPKGEEMKFSSGILNILEDGYTIKHFCDSSDGSSGGPLINSNNYQISGIPKGAAVKGKNFNLGTFLKEPLELFNNKIKNKSQLEQKILINTNNENNCILETKEKNKNNNIEKNYIC